jgi:hypothetical protein
VKRLPLGLILSILIVTTHRLPAPIQEIPESPTRAREPSGKLNAKHKSKPAGEATTSRKADAASMAGVSSNSNAPATVLIYRPAGFPWGMYNGMVVTIDGAQTRTMADPQYSVRKLTPGKHVFEVKGGLTNQRVPIELNLQTAQTYYLRVSINAMGFPEGKINFTRVLPAQGTQETAKLTRGP